MTNFSTGTSGRKSSTIGRRRQIAYVVFLVIFSYVVLVRMEPKPSWQEYYVIIYIISAGCEKIREITSSEPVAISHKFSVWAWNMWNPCDAAAITFFLIGLGLRLTESSMKTGRIIFCVDIVYWYLRILNILGVNKYLGPLVTMMGKMVKNMIYFVVLLLVLIMSFGICRQSILFPDNTFDWSIVRDVFYKPYFMMYGEVFVNEINPECGNDPSQPKCEVGGWITPIVMAMYLLVTNILLVNLLIAVFNNIFIEVNAVSHQVWMFQRFTVVMEYEQKPVLPPPLIMVNHIFLLLKYCRRKLHGVRETYDNALKLFLDTDDLERLYNFGEECVEGYCREKETKLNMSSDERIKNTAERVDSMYQKVEDINQKEGTQTSTMQTVEIRMTKLEELSEQTLQHLAVIHRFMATYTKDQPLAAGLTETADERKTTTQERGDYDPSEHPERKRRESLGRDYPLLRRSRKSVNEVKLESFLDAGLYFRLDDGCASNENSDRFSEKQEEDEDTEEESDMGIKIPVPTLATGMKQTGVDPSLSTSSTKHVDGVEGSFDKSLLEFLKVNSLELRAQGTKGGTNRRVSIDVGGGDSPQHTLRLPPMFQRQRSNTFSGREDWTESEETDDDTDLQTTVTANRSVKLSSSRLKVKQPKRNSRTMMVAMRSEFTSITDELETVCGLLSPPRFPRSFTPRGSPIQTRRDRHHSEMSNPEMAVYLEKEHLKDAEDNDYQLMEHLIQRNYEDKSTENALYLAENDSPEFRNQGLSLRRESAVEMPSPTGAQAQQGPAIFCTDTDTQQLKLLRTSQQSDQSDKTLRKPNSATIC